MRNLTEILADFAAAGRNIKQTIADKKAEGKKIVGVFPIYAPEELVHAAGAFPVGCWGGETSISKATALLPPFACPVMQSITEMSLDGSYDMLDGALISAPCDTLKCFTQNILTTNPDILPMFCIYPQNNKMESAVTYVRCEYKKIAEQLETLTGNKITDGALNQSIAVYNKNRAAMMEFTRHVGARPGIITPTQRHQVIKSRYFVDKEDHTKLMDELNEVLAQTPAPQNKPRTVLLAGIMTEPAAFLRLLDELGFAVVADELAHESRQFRNPVPPGIDQLDRLARQWQNVEACSVVFDPEGKRAQKITSLAKESGAEGVLYCQMKFCEEEEFDYPYVKNTLNEAGIPHLNIEIDPLSRGQEQTRTRLQAFLEQLANT